MKKRIKYILAYFDYKCGWMLTNPNKLERMEKVFLDNYIIAKNNLKNKI